MIFEDFISFITGEFTDVFAEAAEALLSISEYLQMRYTAADMHP